MPECARSDDIGVIVMTKKYPLHRIKAHRVYDVWEVAQTLGCHKKTVIRWIKAKNLPAETTRKPWLIEGKDLKGFLGARQTKPATFSNVAKCRAEYSP